MSGNISVNIIENENKDVDDIFFLNNIDNIENIINEENSSDDNEDTTMAMQLEYGLNYTLKQLKAVASYYKINTRKLKKDELIENIILFEVAEENQSIVYTRKRLWFFVEELKNDEYFNNIIFPF